MVLIIHQSNIMNKGLATASLIALGLALLTMSSDEDAFGLFSLVWMIVTVWLSIRVLMGKVDHATKE